MLFLSTNEGSSMVSKIDCVEEILNKNRNRHPRFEKISRSDDTITFKHESVRLPTGKRLCIDIEYNPTSSFKIRKIIDKDDIYTDATEKYKKDDYVKGILQILDKIEMICKEEGKD
jgi:hypothetical protein